MREAPIAATARGRIYHDATSGRLVRDLAWALDVPLEAKDDFLWAEVESCAHGPLREDVPDCPIPRNEATLA